MKRYQLSLSLTAFLLVSGLATVHAQPAVSCSDRHEILDLISRYSYAVDSADIDAFSGLFTEDATYVFYLFDDRVVLEAADSRDELVALTEIGMETRALQGVQSRHYQTNTIMKAIDEDTVEATTMILAVHQKRFGSPENKFTGYYKDIIVRTDDGWRFKRREAHGDQRSP